MSKLFYHYNLKAFKTLNLNHGHVKFLVFFSRTISLMKSLILLISTHEKLKIIFFDGCWLTISARHRPTIQQQLQHTSGTRQKRNKLFQTKVKVDWLQVTPFLSYMCFFCIQVPSSRYRKLQKITPYILTFRMGLC